MKEVVAVIIFFLVLGWFLERKSDQEILVKQEKTQWYWLSEETQKYIMPISKFSAPLNQADFDTDKLVSVMQAISESDQDMFLEPGLDKYFNAHIVFQIKNLSEGIICSLSSEDALILFNKIFQRQFSGEGPVDKYILENLNKKIKYLKLDEFLSPFSIVSVQEFYLSGGPIIPRSSQSEFKAMSAVQVFSCFKKHVPSLKDVYLFRVWSDYGNDLNLIVRTGPNHVIGFYLIDFSKKEVRDLDSTNMDSRAILYALDAYDLKSSENIGISF